MMCPDLCFRMKGKIALVTFKSPKTLVSKMAFDS